MTDAAEVSAAPADHTMETAALEPYTNGVSAEEHGNVSSTDPADAAASQVPPPQQTEYERYWEVVTKNPEDFAGWEYLIRIAEAANGGITRESSPEDLTNLRSVYDHFLAKFPLCFGYWKKYADWEMAVEGPEKAEQIFERGVASIHNSVDLWTQYCSFQLEHSKDEEAIRGVFERGATAVGYDFLSHIFWDKYIEFEESKEHFGRVMAILERVIRIPLHQYARYFEKYSQLSVTRPVTELLPQEDLQRLEAEVREPPKPQEGAEEETPQVPEKTEEEIQNELRQRIHSIKSEIYMHTQAEVHKRWVYEAEIKRPYFHVKPLDESQLANWRRYLDFEESEGDDARVYVLYERCLVACALYEEFWARYARYLIGRGDSENARNVFIRATTVFVPATQPKIRLTYAAFEEEHGRIKEVRDIYQKLLEIGKGCEERHIPAPTADVPGHVETIIKFAHFERRQGSVEKAEEIIDSGITTAPDDRSKAYLTCEKAKLIQYIKGDVEAARKVYLEGGSQYPDSKFLWISYLKFEMDQSSSEHVDQVYASLKSTSTLPVEDKRDLAQRYLDYLLERGTDISLYNKVEAEILKEMGGPIDAGVGKGAGESRKRPLEDNSPYRQYKQARTTPLPTHTAHPAAAAAAAAPTAAASYYPPAQVATTGATGWGGAVPYTYGQQVSRQKTAQKTACSTHNHLRSISLRIFFVCFNAFPGICWVQLRRFAYVFACVFGEASGVLA
ncbi:hypothetical protein HK102_005834 [Quaeritorhiza haematococci]|nr:hypothetical protein HK102_005834 [Quaeritorhiza haematococci]